MNNKKVLRMVIHIYFCIAVFIAFPFETLAEEGKPMKLAIVGLVHGHVHGFLRQLQNREDIDLVAVCEEQEDLLDQYAERYDFDREIGYLDLAKMLEEKKPEAVATFTSTFDHAEVVETCAKLGVHVMMEKPLAVSNEHAKRIESAAEAHNIFVMVNYETTWYPSHHYLYQQIIDEKKIGEPRKFVVRDGHSGPKEIGCAQEFLSWLTDPILNGGGALMDFGCYGANLITWLMKNERPISVTAITQQIKPHVYPKVDDEATILVTYPTAQGIIQASWNWPFNRKDMDVYGTEGYAKALNRTDVETRYHDQGKENQSITSLDAPHNNPLTYLKYIVSNKMEPQGLSSLKNNLIVTEILDAARRSATTGETLYLDK